MDTQLKIETKFKFSLQIILKWKLNIFPVLDKLGIYGPVRNCITHELEGYFIFGPGCLR